MAIKFYFTWEVKINPGLLKNASGPEEFCLIKVAFFIFFIVLNVKLRNVQSILLSYSPSVGCHLNGICKIEAPRTTLT